MTSNKVGKLFLVLAAVNGVAANVFAGSVNDPCGGDSALISLINRPTVADSACVVPFRKVVVESGYQYQQLTHSAGNQQDFPEAQFRLGLPANNEFVLLLPNYIHQSLGSVSGTSATIVGIKHKIGYNQSWLASAETLFTLPNGSAAYGSKGTGVALNGIVSYSVNSAVSMSFMLGVTSQTQSSQDGGGRFTSVNPDLVVAYLPTQMLALYGEVYGQTNTGPGEGSGYNADAGVIYLLMPKIAIDLEVGHRISGTLSGFNQYIGAGLSFMV